MSPSRPTAPPPTRTRRTPPPTRTRGAPPPRRTRHAAAPAVTSRGCRNGITEAGLLKRRPGYYTVRLGLVVGAFAAGWGAFFALGDTWWQLAVAAFLALVFGQVALVAHDRRTGRCSAGAGTARSEGGCSAISASA